MRKYSSLPPEDTYQGDATKHEIELKAGPRDPLPVVFENRYAVIVDDTVRFPNGDEGKYMRIFHPAELEGRRGTVMLPKFGDRYVLMRIFRHPTRSWELECPRGFAELGLSAEENARKEIDEELGVEVKTLVSLGDVCPNTGLLATRAEVFFVEIDALPTKGGKDRDKGTIVAYEAVTREELLAKIAAGEIRDAFTLGAVALFFARESAGFAAPHIAKKSVPVETPHRFGTFIEGFDSILYNPQLRANNRVRFLAETFYGLIFDSRIILAEPMIFDNSSVIRLMTRLRDEGKEPLRQAFAYSHFRSVEDTLIKTLLNPTYVSSCFSSEAEKCRIQFAKKILPGTWHGLAPQAAELVANLLKESCLTDEDRIYLLSVQRGMQHGEWLWSYEYKGRTDHGYKMSEQVSDWLFADDRGLPDKVSKLLTNAEFWPEQKILPGGFNDYFKARSLFHQSKPLWRNALGKDDFDRLDEYINSAYMLAIQKTCQASHAVCTPMDFDNASHVTAQQVMQSSGSTARRNVEFRLNFVNIGQSNSTMLQQVEDGLLACLNELHGDNSFLDVKKSLSALRLDDEDYAGKYLDAFNTLIERTNAVGGPFKLLIEGNRVVNVLQQGGTEVSRCAKEVDPAAHFESANGCETRE